MASQTLPITSLPHATRSQVFDALFTLLQRVPAPGGLSWRTFSQKLQQWDDVPGANQPALFLYRGPQTAEQKAFAVTKWHWRVDIIIYYRTDSLQCAEDQGLYPDQILDSIIDSIEQVMQTDPLLDRQTLNGTCWHCWIDGAIVFDSGIIDNQAVVVVPLSILI